MFQPVKLLSRYPVKSQLFKRFQSTIKAPPPPPPSGPKKPTGIKALMKEYGFSALGIYLGLSAIDLPLCYLLVHSAGKEEIEYYENKIKQTFGFGISDDDLKRQQEIDQLQQSQEDLENPIGEESQSTLSYVLSQFSWAEFAIAYTIHKSFIFIRLPLTAAITPPVVKLLRGWGFKLGSQSIKTSANIAKDHIKDFTASSSKFGTRPTQKKKWFNFFF
ncbi:hypothetical protein CANTEDRAFT_111000 [Yamadazyma tenuis ATCC 10573]|uniref:DUF1279 domain-containing protein n=2 Tax=Candida tenuis TaxID=2315449 RepID=G3BF25_CANTC|nr:uncharacterized protein CANTEDRAFT_111000 [Yamadazyma tenuis ATCC 10573]EGV59995.1 hypothetical protein CANTEDRAFT_111000 [Yamadazyma tenuis ATCC 10573]